MRIERLAERIVNLHFVDAAQIDAAVAARGHADLELQVEVFEFLLGAKIRKTLPRLTGNVGRRPICQHTIFHRPAVLAAVLDDFPPREITAVEQRNWRSEL